MRLALEEAGADYVDVARRGRQTRRAPAMMKLLESNPAGAAALCAAVPEAGKDISRRRRSFCSISAPRLSLAPRDEAGRLWAHQLQLTVTDLVVHIHDTHHPVSGWLYYEEQRPAAKRRTADFWRYRAPKFLGYFERVLQRNGGKYMVGRRLTYVDLSLFQIVEGLRYAFPKRMKRFEKKVPLLIALHDRVAKRPRIAAYLVLETAHPVQPMGHLSVFQGAGRAEGG